MADDSYQANQDVIYGGRSIRYSPAQLQQLAALMALPPADNDPRTAGLGTHSGAGPAYASSDAPPPSVTPDPALAHGKSAHALASALASAPMPPARPAAVPVQAIASPPPQPSPAPSAPSASQWANGPIGSTVTSSPPGYFRRC